MVVYNLVVESPNITKVILTTDDIEMGKVSFYLDGDKWVCIDSRMNPSIQHKQFTIMTHCKDMVEAYHRSLSPNVPTHNID
jgi:hypothetical protein